MANEKRLIDANALMDAFRSYMVERYDKEKCVSEENCKTCEKSCLWRKIVTVAPTVDAVEVVHGRWIEDYETFVQDNGYESEPIHTGFLCSVCGRHSCSIEPYCHCGAKMDGGNEDG